MKQPPTDTAEQGGCVVKHVHYSDKQTQILKDVLTTQLQICAQTMTQSALLGHVWLPPNMVECTILRPLPRHPTPVTAMVKTVGASP